MNTIITGNFEQQEEAEKAIAELASAGFSAKETARFFVDPPIAMEPPLSSPGDVHVDKPAKGAATGAAVGGAVGVAVGLAASVVAGPAAPIAGAGVGAYVGSLAGAMSRLDDRSAPKIESPEVAKFEGEGGRRAGTLVAVTAASQPRQQAAISILRANGAEDIDHAEGTIVDGQWTDFDRTAPLRRVAG